MYCAHKSPHSENGRLFAFNWAESHSDFIGHLPGKPTFRPSGKSPTGNESTLGVCRYLSTWKSETESERAL
jgi:hypothetical protein